MKKGFTLIEMVVVLTIMAVLTHLAVREVGSFRNDKLRKMAYAQLEEVDGAIRSFAADMGRLPIGLEELWIKPAETESVALRDVHDEDAQVDMGKVMMAYGWRGPYIRLPIGKSKLYDPWGNECLMVDCDGWLKVGHRGANVNDDADDVFVDISRYTNCTVYLSVYCNDLDIIEPGKGARLIWPTGNGVGIFTNEFDHTATITGLTPGEKRVWCPKLKKAWPVTVNVGTNELSVTLVRTVSG